MTQTAWAAARRRGRPPASDSAVTRERILLAAQKVFAESGFEAATFQTIADEIGLTRPAINNYFSSKSALYTEVVGRVGEQVLDAIHAASAERTLAEQVLTFIRLVMRSEDVDPSQAGLLVHAAMDGKRHPVPDCQAAELIERFIRSAVAAAALRGEVRTGSEGMSDVLIGLVWGTAFQLGRGDVARADRMLEQLGAVLDRGLLR